MNNDLIFSELKQLFADIAVRQAETAREIYELRAFQAETNKQLRETNRRLESFGIVQGEIAEDLFRRNSKVLFEKQNIKIDRIITRQKREEGNEYDIVAINEHLVVVFEIKNKLRSGDVIRFVNVQLPLFKKNFPEYENLKLYWGIGAPVVKGSVK